MKSRLTLSHLIIEQSSDAVIFANKSGVIEIWNPAAERIFGFSADEAIGRDLDLIVPERYRKAHWDGFHRALNNGTTQYKHPMLTRSLHKSRDPFYVELSFAIIKDPAGEAIGAMATARDATERHLKERNR